MKSIKLRKCLAFLAKIVSPGYGCCFHCGMPWNFTEHRTVWHDVRRGCFALCKSCWGLTTVSQRISYHLELIEKWERDSGLDGKDKAVLAKEITDAIRRAA